MIKQKKEFLILFSLFFLILLPNSIFVLMGNDTAVITPVKQAVFYLYSIALLIFPLSFIKPKLFFGISILFLPFAITDFYVLFLSGTQSTAMHYAAIFSTNFEEAKELVGGNLFFAFLGLIYILAYIYLYLKLNKQTHISRLLKYGVALFSLIIILGIFVRDYNIAKKEKQAGDKLGLAFGFFEIKLDKTFPIGSINKMFGVVDGVFEKNKFEENNKNFQYNSIVNNNKNLTLVLVIGEAARRNNFQLYGYMRQTNPLLSKMNNLIVYSDVIANANFTQTSFPQIVTSIGPEQYAERYNEKGIIAAFKEAGYQTYWITNQPYYPNSLYYLYANGADYYKDISTSFEMISYDEKILPYVEGIINDSHKKRLIVIHCIGSHYRYNLRYPKSFEKYHPVLDGSISIGGNSPEYKDRYVNSYDNSLLYTDYFLAELINKMKGIDEPSLMMYVSDHGENLYDDEKELFLHGTAQPSKYELEIPLLIWNSDNYNSNNVEKLKSSIYKKLSTEIVFHTLSHLGGFTTKLHKVEFDLLSDSLKSGNRKFLLGSGKVITIDN